MPYLHAFHDEIDEIERLLDEIGRLRAALKQIHDYADGCMEGAGEPEFSQFASICNTISNTIKQRGF